MQSMRRARRSLFDSSPDIKIESRHSEVLSPEYEQGTKTQDSRFRTYNLVRPNSR